MIVQADQKHSTEIGEKSEQKLGINLTCPFVERV
jgi:hypothetical protein